MDFAGVHCTPLNAIGDYSYLKKPPIRAALVLSVIEAEVFICKAHLDDDAVNQKVHHLKRGYE